MGKIRVISLGVEGGGLDIFGKQTDGLWSFWTQGNSWGLDENDDEFVRSWSTPPVDDLLQLIPKEWLCMSPIEIHPEFVGVLRVKYENDWPGCAGQLTGDWLERIKRRWDRAFGVN